MKVQKFIHKCEKYNGEEIDIDFDIFRELPVNIHFNSPRWYFHISGIQVDLKDPYMDVEPHNEIKNKMFLKSLYLSFHIINKIEFMYLYL